MASWSLALGVAPNDLCSALDAVSDRRGADLTIVMPPSLQEI